jgi:hypothetical protein
MKTHGRHGGTCMRVVRVGVFLRLCEGIGYCSKTSGIAVVLATSVNIVIYYRHAEPKRKQWDQFAW